MCLMCVCIVGGLRPHAVDRGCLPWAPQVHRTFEIILDLTSKAGWHFAASLPGVRKTKPHSQNLKGQTEARFQTLNWHRSIADGFNSATLSCCQHDFFHKSQSPSPGPQTNRDVDGSVRKPDLPGIRFSGGVQLCGASLFHTLPRFPC